MVKKSTSACIHHGVCAYVCVLVLPRVEYSMNNANFPSIFMAIVEIFYLLFNNNPKYWPP